MFDTLAFWSTLLVVGAIWQLSAPAAVRLRAGALVAGSVVVIGRVVPLDWRQWGLLALSVVWVAVGARLASQRRPTRPFAISLIICAPMLLMWATGKTLALTGFTSGRVLLFVGLSYLVVKAFTLAKDACDGRVANPDPIVVAGYLLFFPTFIAGPMHLFSEFETTVARPGRTDATGAVNIVYRFLVGMLKVRVLVPLLKPMSLLALPADGSPRLLAVLGASIVYSLVLLLDFSGYTDMAISSAAIIGVRTPENFNAPYLARSIREFWQRWHITFSRVLTGYLFIPITRTLQRQLGHRRVLLLGIGYFTTFLFCGYWHGAGLNFIAWGLYHAAGLFLLDAIRTSRGPASPPAPATASAALPRTLGIAGTFMFVSIGWILFVLPLSAIARIHW